MAYDAIQQTEKRIRITVAYDGTNYSGWQLQKNGKTIEGELHRALCSILGKDIAITGASRTDAGVHSLGNVAVFDTDSRIPPEKFAFALNARLPDDIVVLHSEEVSPQWHPRHVESRKTYEYRILNRRMPDPTRRLYTCFCHWNLSLEAMQEAAGYLEGRHDFESFSSARKTVETTVRTIYSCRVERMEDLVTIRVTGSGFLYNMVRIIAGTLLDVGRGMLEPKAIPEIMKARNRQAAGPTAPAHGLTMIGIEYDTF